MSPPSGKDSGKKRQARNVSRGVEPEVAATPERLAEPPVAELAPAQQALLRLTGAKLCYGKPIEAGTRTVIPVASVRTAGGFGFGRTSGQTASDDANGGGGGGAIDARPVGFIEIGPDGTRFQPIDDRRLSLAVVGAGTLATLALAHLLTRGRRSRRRSDELGRVVSELRRTNPGGRRGSRLLRSRPAQLPLPVEPTLKGKAH
jgi:uncharacterized spore protein YtfJ